ncbi:cell division protein FtsQ [Tamaricihabitans halophyticus]|uniref:Cell division protein FtsQ n=1 Tax=Tamaricihabitans halophyticus TaxID=1262583 RepID=A0A4R2QBB1_9PSEU|nr:FtsQ-type POTRA domain-containing protein [Tamaricihabitans halophyticus]TCP45408.1 cell division protein FtsQ [Tamaricihabitans halophyticus]
MTTTRRATSRARARRARYERQRERVNRSDRHPKLPSRRRAHARRWVALLVLLGVLGVAYLLLFSGVLGVRSVEVDGTTGLSKHEVRAAAEVPMGQPMLRVDTDELATRVVDKLPRAATAEVSRSWPSTLQIQVTERVPIAIFEADDGPRLVDKHSVAFKPAGDVPKGLPRLELDAVSPEDRISTAVIKSLRSMPEGLRGKVTSMTADTPGSVEFRLADGKLVRWGNAADGERKAAVLAALLQQRGKIFDVSSPELPTVS